MNMFNYKQAAAQLMGLVQPVGDVIKAEELRLLGQFIDQSQGIVRPIMPTNVPPPGMTLFRGVEGGGDRRLTLRESVGDIGRGVYLTPDARLAASYGGGPNARVSNGTRTVHKYTLGDVPPEQKAFVIGGAKIGENVQIKDGTGKELYNGPWGAKEMDAALSAHPQIKAVIGTEGSIGINQVMVRDHSLLK